MAALSRRTHKLSTFACFCKLKVVKHLRTCSKVLSRGDPLEVFLRKDVRTILHRITGFDPDRTFGIHKVRRGEAPVYKVLTDEELKQEMEKTEKTKKRRLQMPPFMNCREPHDKLLADDPEIAPVLNSKFVFIDISEDSRRIKDYSLRPIVCRYEDGKLKTVDWKTFDRFSQIYHPVPGREIFCPKMFDEENLEGPGRSHFSLSVKPSESPGLMIFGMWKEEQTEVVHVCDKFLKVNSTFIWVGGRESDNIIQKLLNEDNYLYILERACVQFEPDSSDFIRVTHRIYEHIAANHCFDCLRATRFFGPMSFYFAWINKIEPLLADMINKDLLIDAIDLINLKRIIQHQSIKEGDILTIIKDYYLEDSNKHHIEVLRTALDGLDRRLEEKMQKKKESL